MIKNQGYQAAFIWTGAFQGVVILIVAQFLRHPPRGTSEESGRDGAGIGATAGSTTTPPLRCCGRRSSTFCTRRS